MKDEHRRTDRRAYRLIAFGVVLYVALSRIDAIGNALAWLVGLLTPVLLGMGFALILNVPMRGFQGIFARIGERVGKCDGRGKARAERVVNGFSLLLSVLTVILILFVLIRFILPQFFNAITNVVNIVRENREEISAFVAKIGLDANAVDEKLNEIINWVYSNLTKIAGTTLTAALSVFSSVTDIVLALILAIYMLADKVALSRRAKNGLRALLPERASSFLTRVGSMFVSTFRIFLSRQCLEALILGGLLLVCMLIFRLPYALSISCMTALLALLPYIGAYLSLFIGCVLIVTVSPMKALIFAVVFFVAQQVEGNLIYPRVVGKSVGLPAYLTLAAVMVGGSLAGIPGMLLIIPVVSVIYMLLREFVHRKNAEKDALKRQDDA